MIKKIVIYGYSGAAKDIIYSLDSLEYRVVGIIDDAESAPPTNPWADVPVKSVNHINEWDYDYIIISTQRHAESMIKHLMKQSVDENKIIVWKNTDKLPVLDQRIAYLHLCTDLIKERKIDGACAEVGVYKGEFAKYINKFLPDRKLYLFDTFEGFGNQNILDLEIQQFKQGVLEAFYDTSINEVIEKMTNKSNCIIRKGYFPQTVKNEEEKYALVSLDADIYTPILDGLNYFYPRLAWGGYIFVHDYGGYDWPGVRLAVEEYSKHHKIAILPILDNNLSLIITK